MSNTTEHFIDRTKGFSYKSYKIPKKRGFRKIVAPSSKLLKYQQKQLRTIQKTFRDTAVDYGVEQHFHGFVRGKSPVTAAKRLIGQTTFIQMDIANFFDSVTPQHVIDSCADYAIAADNCLWHHEGYAAQGYATSPMLANIALIPFASKLNSYLRTLDCHTEFHIYADDITITTDIIDYDMEKEIIATVTELIEFYKFVIKPTKTRVRYTTYGYVRVLGVNVGKDDMRVPRRIRRKMRAALHGGTKHSLGGLSSWQAHIKKANDN